MRRNVSPNPVWIHFSELQSPEFQSEDYVLYHTLQQSYVPQRPQCRSKLMCLRTVHASGFNNQMKCLNRPGKLLHWNCSYRTHHTCIGIKRVESGMMVIKICTHLAINSTISRVKLVINNLVLWCLPETVRKLL